MKKTLKSLSSFGLKLNLLIMPSNKINELSLAIVKELMVMISLIEYLA